MMKDLKVFDGRPNAFEPYKIQRLAVRSVIIRGNKLLMDYLKKTSEYKFPGGGVEPGENYFDALKRELMEEAGARVKGTPRVIGYIDQLYPDRYDINKLFSMRSLYYLVEIEDKMDSIQLSESEIALGFVPVWVGIDDAIALNQKCFDEGSLNHWTQRELWMLNYIRDNLMAK